MARKLTQLPKTQFSGMDYENIISDITNLVKDNPDFNTNWDDFLSSDAGRMLVELFAYIADQLSTRVDWMVNENWIGTATQKRSVMRILKLIGYNFYLPSSSKVIVTMDMTGDSWPGNFYLTQPYSTLTGTVTPYSLTAPDKKGVSRNYELISYDSINNKYDYKTGYLIDSNMMDLDFYEGSTKVENFTATTENAPTFTLTNNPIINNSVRVYFREMIGGNPVETELLKVDSFLDPYAQMEEYSDGSPVPIPYILTINEDETITIEFGSTGILPSSKRRLAVGDNIKVFYRTGGGVDGNLAYQAINTTRSILITPIGFFTTRIINPSFINKTAGIGGAEGESAEHAATYAPLQLRTADKAVSSDDYNILLNAIGSVLTAKAYGAHNIDQDMVYDKYEMFINPLDVWCYLLPDKGGWRSLVSRDYNKFEWISLRNQNYFNAPNNFTSGTFNYKQSFSLNDIQGDTLNGSLINWNGFGDTKFYNYITFNSPDDFKNNILGNTKFRAKFTNYLDTTQQFKNITNLLGDSFYVKAGDTKLQIKENINAYYQSAVNLEAGINLTTKNKIKINVDNMGDTIVDLRTYSYNFVKTTSEEIVRAINAKTYDERYSLNLPGDSFATYQGAAYSSSLNLFVVCGSSSDSTANREKIITSSNGTTWTKKTIGTTGDSKTLKDVCWSPELGKFIACATTSTGYVKAFFKSTTGDTWTGISVGDSASPERIVWCPELSKFVAIGATGRGTTRVWTSTTGDTWTLGSSANDNKGWYRLTWAKELGLFIAASWDDAIMTSPNGINWTLNSFTLGDSNNCYYGEPAWSNYLGCAIIPFADDRTVPNKYGVIKSSNGINWTRLEIGTGNYARVEGSIWSDIEKMFLINHHETISGVVINSLLISYDGVIWYKKIIDIATPPIGSSTNYFSRFTYRESTRQFITASGTGGTTNKPRVLSFNLYKFATVEQPSLTEEYIKLTSPYTGDTYSSIRFSTTLGDSDATQLIFGSNLVAGDTYKCRGYKRLTIPVNTTDPTHFGKVIYEMGTLNLEGSNTKDYYLNYLKSSGDTIPLGTYYYDNFSQSTDPEWREVAKRIYNNYGDTTPNIFASDYQLRFTKDSTDSMSLYKIYNDWSLSKATYPIIIGDSIIGYGDTIIGLNSTNYNIKFNIDGIGDLTVDITGNAGITPNTYKRDTVIGIINNELSAFYSSGGIQYSNFNYATYSGRTIKLRSPTYFNNSYIKIKPVSNNATKELLGSSIGDSGDSHIFYSTGDYYIKYNSVADRMDLIKVDNPISNSNMPDGTFYTHFIWDRTYEATDEDDLLSYMEPKKIVGLNNVFKQTKISTFDVVGIVYYNSAYSYGTVKSAVDTTIANEYSLLDSNGILKRDYGQTISKSKFMNLVHTVSGVDRVEITFFGKDADDITTNQENTIECDFDEIIVLSNTTGSHGLRLQYLETIL